MYELWFDILRDFMDYLNYMGLSLMVRLCKWSLLSLISYNLGGFVIARARLLLRCHLRPPAPPLSLCHPRSARVEHRRRHWSSELRLGRSPPTREPFFDSSLPELRPRFVVAGHASERLVTHGELRSPSFSSPARAPPPRAWSARHRAFWHRLVSASCLPLHRDAREPLQSRSTGPAPRVDGEQRHRSAMAGGELALVHFRSRKGVHLVRLEP